MTGPTNRPAPLGTASSGHNAATNATTAGNTTGSIGDCVFVDRNNNGFREPDERGIVGAVVTLTVFDGTVLEAAADSDCFYTFDGLPAGTYTVAVNSTSNPTNGQKSRTVSLAAGENNADVDFGYSVTGVKGVQVEAQPLLAFTGGNALFGAAVALILAGLGGLLAFRKKQKFLR